MIKRNIIIVFLLFLIFSLIPLQTASAAPKLEVNAQAGIAGKMKYITPVPLKVTITNNGSNFSGDLVIDAFETYSTNSSIVYPLDIAEGETKTIELILNGMGDRYSSNGQPVNQFYFYEGGIEKGKAISYSGTKYISATQKYDPYTLFLFTLTENSDRLSVFTKYSQNAPNGLEVVHLNQIKDYELPSDPKGLAMANILVVDEFNISDLTKEQQNAILQWVQSGGILLVGASDQISSSMGILRSYMPLSISNERTQISKETLENLSGAQFDEGIEVYKGTENKDSKTILSDGNTILASEKNLGSGKIIQTTFSLGDHPQSDMADYRKLLEKVIDVQTLSNSAINNNFYRSSNDYLSTEVASVNELFPSFEVSTVWLIVIMILYILVIGVLLYIILKRMDKREHAWWIIPVISVALSVVMFIVGGRDRIMNAQIQQSAYFKVNEDQSLQGYYVESLLSNRGGDFTFTTDKQTTASVKNDMNPNVETAHKMSYVKLHNDGSTVTLKNMNYWSVRSIMGESKIENAGNMDIQLTLKEGKIEGTIKNNFPFSLHDVEIWSGMNQIELGDIEASETLQVSKKAKSSVLLSPSFVNDSYMMPATKEDLVPTRLAKLKYGANQLVNGNQSPAVVAWTDESIVGIEFNGNAKMSSITYLIQSFKPEMVWSGEINISNDVLDVSVNPLNDYEYIEMVDQQKNEWFLSSGGYEYFVGIPNEILSKIKTWNELSVLNQDLNLKLSIWNEKSGVYEDLTDYNTTISKNPDDYISETGEIKFKFDYMDEEKTVLLPLVELKGVGVND